MTDDTHPNGRRDVTKMLMAVSAAAWGVLCLAGAGWIGSIQSQVTTAQTINAQLSVALAKLETKVLYVERENSDLRVKFSELERTARRGPP